MRNGRYVIGIDLGTTNCAVAFVDTFASIPRPEVFPVPQPATLDSVARSLTTPSLLYYLDAAERDTLESSAELAPMELDGVFACGRYALSRISNAPGRVIHSAKSWFVHPELDKHDAILPWGSEDVRASEKRSPLGVSSLLLGYIRDAWIREHDSFDDEEILITVPASFDESAQRLTLEAASVAGYPGGVRLLEEPQAAFYSYLVHGDDALETLRALPGESPKVLVCDVGGGTTDLSLFAFERSAAEPLRRLSVSEHILLGGDNIDLAIAVLLEGRAGMKLSARQRQWLFFHARAIKERLLSADALPVEEVSVSVPGEGAGLFASSRTIRAHSREILDALSNGFFPDVPRDVEPLRRQTGLREFGLPYAPDSAITRHLAGFLRGSDVHAVLYNGGTLEASAFRTRLTAQIERWQGFAPVELDNRERALAVARGAAEYGYRLRSGKGRIRAGYPRSVYLELGGSEDRKLLCILPKGLGVGEMRRVDEPAFEAVVGEPVRFQAVTATGRPDDRSGDIVPFDSRTFHELPPLESLLAVQPGLPRGALRVALEASVNELGLLQLFCVHEARSGQEGRWELQFNLRSKAAPVSQLSGAAASRYPDVKLRAASEKILSYYGKSRSGVEPEPPRKLVRELEAVLEDRREQWDLAALRALWPALLPGLTRRNRSPQHETVWFQLAGYVLRPGYGFPLDTVRMSEIWRLQSLGRSFRKDANSRVQWHIMWRRVSGGLDRLQQEALFEDEHSTLALKGGDEAEMVRLLASLERINHDMKVEFGTKLADFVSKNPASPLFDHVIWALGRLGSRILLYGGSHNVVPAPVAEKWVGSLLAFPWRQEKAPVILNAILQMARRGVDPTKDVNEDLREDIRGRAKAAGISGDRLRRLDVAELLDEVAMNQLFGEALPLGLRLVPEGL